jgi:hypothetical protein
MDDKMKQRCDELFAIGLRFNGQSYTKVAPDNDINFHYTDIMCYDDEKWKKSVEGVKKEIELREAIRAKSVPTCTRCGKDIICDEWPCTLEEDRKKVNLRV